MPSVQSLNLVPGALRLRWGGVKVLEMFFRAQECGCLENCLRVFPARRRDVGGVALSACDEGGRFDALADQSPPALDRSLPWLGARARGIDLPELRKTFWFLTQPGTLACRSILGWFGSVRIRIGSDRIGYMHRGLPEHCLWH